MKYDIGNKIHATKALEEHSVQATGQTSFTVDNTYIIKFGMETGKMVIDDLGIVWHVDDEMLKYWFTEHVHEDDHLARYLYAMGVVE